MLSDVIELVLQELLGKEIYRWLTNVIKLVF